MIYNKLVRDRIPEIIAQQGKTVSFRALKGDELKKALKDKLIEEVNELINAETEEQIIVESVDIVEVLDHLLIQYGTNLASICTGSQRSKKAKENGSFWNGYFLESVGDEE